MGILYKSAEDMTITAQDPTGSDRLELKSPDTEAGALPLHSHESLRGRWLRMGGVEGIVQESLSPCRAYMCNHMVKETGSNANFNPFHKSLGRSKGSPFLFLESSDC